MIRKTRGARFAFGCLLAALAAAGMMPAAHAADKPRALTIQLATYPASILGINAPWELALRNGYLRDAGLDVTYRGSVGGSTDVHALMTGDIVYAETGLPAILAAIQEGADIKIISQNERGYSTLVWITKADSPLTKIDDLKGHKLGSTTPKGPFQMLDMMVLKKHGLTEKDTPLVYAGGIQQQMLLLDNGAIDAALISADIYLGLPADKYKIIGKGNEELPPLASSIGITTSKMAKEQGPVLAKLIAARRKGMEYLLANRAQANETLAKSAKVSVQEADRYYPYIVDPGFLNPGDLVPTSWDTEINGLVDVGAMTEKVDWRKSVDQEFLPKDLQHPLN